MTVIVVLWQKHTENGLKQLVGLIIVIRTSQPIDYPILFSQTFHNVLAVFLLNATFSEGYGAERKDKERTKEGKKRE